MSKFAQIITSFDRTGNFPIESNYIFPTLEDLKQFYSDPLQSATLHKGLLKIVESNSENKQALYWVTKKQTNDELEFTELIASDNVSKIIEKLESLQTELTKETKERKLADTALWGTENPTDISEDLNSINDLANQIKAIKEVLDSLKLKDTAIEKNIQLLSGSPTNDIEEFLKTLPFKNIAELSKTLDKVIKGTEDVTEEIDSISELKNFLKGFKRGDTLQDSLENLWNRVVGDPIPSKDFLTLKGIEDFVLKYKTTNDSKVNTLLEELNHIETGVGLNAEGSFSPDPDTNYLTEATSVMHALRILDKTLKRYVSVNAPQVRNNDEAVKLSITQELDSYVLGATLKLSTQAGNQLIKNTDGLFVNAKTYYENGVLTFRVNDSIVSQHYIGMDAIVKSATYDKTNEQLVFVFKLDNGDTQTVNIPVHALIREWEISNRDTSVVELNRVVDISGTDTLSADVRIAPDQFNILKKIGNTLYAEGTTNVIYHEGQRLSEYLKDQIGSSKSALEKLKDFQSVSNSKFEDLQNKITNEATSRSNEDKRILDKFDTLETKLSKTENSLDKKEEVLTSIKDSITKEIQRAATEENRLQLEINSESERATQVEEHHSKNLQTLGEKIDVEIARSISVDKELSAKIDNKHIPEYTIIKQSTPEYGCLASYYLTKDGIFVGNKIDIPKTPINLETVYDKGNFTLKLNGENVNTTYIGISNYVKESYYKQDTNELVQVFELPNGNTQEVRTNLNEAAVSKMEFNSLKTEIEKLKSELAEINLKWNTVMEQIN